MVNIMTDTPKTPAFTFDNSYARLPAHFFAPVSPEKAPSPKLIAFNQQLAEELQLPLHAADKQQLAAIFSGNQLPPDAEPLALAYAGHQFGNFVPQLGDGRAVLLGEVIDKTGQRFDIQLKGSGRTPFSRQGDGRAPLGPVLREYLLSEAMHALGVPSSRALAAVSTGETVYREQALPGAVVTRVASSHIRFGTFQYFAARGDAQSIRQLADYVIERHYPTVGDEANAYMALLEAVVAKQAELVTKWMLLGFIHGVMNTDNMSVCGETIDYGPCAFMDSFHPDTVYSYIDQARRYAWKNQPAIAQWNLARFAETLLPLISDNEQEGIELATNAVKAFNDQYQQYWRDGMRAKLGLQQAQEEDDTLIQNLLQMMLDKRVDYTLFFRRLCDVAESPDNSEPVSELFPGSLQITEWLQQWRQRSVDECVTDKERARLMRRHNPAFVPRNHLVEQAIQAAVNDQDFSLFERLLSVWQKPYDEQPVFEMYMQPPEPEEMVHQTFCGT